MFIKAYVARIKAGQMTIEQVPEVVRVEVQEALDAVEAISSQE